MRRTLEIVVFVVFIASAFGYVVSLGVFGERQGWGEVTSTSRAPATVARRVSQLERAREQVAAPGEKQILFGDLHAHTTLSFDAFSISLPMNTGEGAHPPADACDFARFCAGLDFWSINDHAESLTARDWAETREMVRSCNAAAGDPANPDMVTYLGWEWTQIGPTPETHYGHKNVILRDVDDDVVPARPIASREQLFPGGDDPYNAIMRLGLIAAAPGGQGRQPYHDFALYLRDRSARTRCETGIDVRALPPDCAESASTPTELFEKMDEWGFPYLVIPHGNTWGFYTPPLTSWDKQLRSHSDPERHEFLIEVFSGHGNIERYRPWRALGQGGDGEPFCPAPSDGYTPECWQAGEIIRARCLEEGATDDDCDARATDARRQHVILGGSIGYLTVPGSQVEDWLDAGQCTDCYMPAYNHRPGGSVQYALAIRDFEGDAASGKRFRFGLIGSSDIHSARPGTGYKEFARLSMTDAALGQLGPPPILRAADPVGRAVPAGEVVDLGPYFERFASFFGAGGLVAAHSTGRDRDSIWDALNRKEVYATSGPRILLWFDRVESETGERWPMGSSVATADPPAFEVRALGELVQQPGCPDDAAFALGADRLEKLCRSECFHPGEQRARIDRIEVVRIRPQSRPDESVDDLIEDPWRVLPCPPGGGGCVASFDDPEFSSSDRDTVYYVRAIQEPSPTVNGANLRCEQDASGACIAVEPCRAGDPTSRDDDCLADAEERAWSSPIFVDHARAAEPPR